MIVWELGKYIVILYKGLDYPYWLYIDGDWSGSFHSLVEAKQFALNH